MNKEKQEIRKIYLIYTNPFQEIDQLVVTAYNDKFRALDAAKSFSGGCKVVEVLIPVDVINPEKTLSSEEIN